VIYKQFNYFTNTSLHELAGNKHIVVLMNTISSTLTSSLTNVFQANVLEHWRKTTVS